MKKIHYSIIIFTTCLLLAACNIEQRNGDKWTTYTNSKYGFSINHPKTLNDNKVKVKQKKNQFSIEIFDGTKWEMEVLFTIGINIKDEKDLDAFIKNEYGETCELSEIHKELNANGLNPVSIKVNSMEEGCWINWITLLSYSPEKEKVVAIHLGHEPPLVEMTENGYIDYNNKTVESFRFTN